MSVNARLFLHCKVVLSNPTVSAEGNGVSALSFAWRVFWSVIDAIFSVFCVDTTRVSSRHATG